MGELAYSGRPLLRSVEEEDSVSGLQEVSVNCCSENAAVASKSDRNHACIQHPKYCIGKLQPTFC
jgi:hypothetical protein